MRTATLGAAVLLMLAALCCANDYQYYKGYYWRDGYPYRLEYRQRCDGRGKCYREPYYVRVPYTPPAKHPQAAHSGGGWREELTEIATAQLRWRLEYSRLQREQRDFDEALRGLGLEDAVSGVPGPYSIYAASATRAIPLAAQGSTVYGYNLTQRTEPAVDLMRLYNEASQLARGAQSLGSQATGDFHALVAQETAAQAESAQREIEIRRILARGQAAREFLQALSEPEVRESESRMLLTPGGGSAPAVAPPAPGAGSPDGALVGRLAETIQRRCLPCHGPQSGEFAPQGGLDMTRFLVGMSAEERERVLARLVTDDPAKLMPRDPQTGKGTALTWEELSLFFAAAGLH